LCLYDRSSLLMCWVDDAFIFALQPCIIFLMPDDHRCIVTLHCNHGCAMYQKLLQYCQYRWILSTLCCLSMESSIKMNNSSQPSCYDELHHSMSTGTCACRPMATQIKGPTKTFPWWCNHQLSVVIKRPSPSSCQTMGETGMITPRLENQHAPTWWMPFLVWFKKEVQKQGWPLQARHKMEHSEFAWMLQKLEGF